MANLVSERTKQNEVETIVSNAAANYESGLTTEKHHRLASEYDAVSRNDRRNVMGNPYYYCEILPIGPQPITEYASGATSAVPHVFEVWLIYEWSDADPYSGSSQETFDDITEGLSPNGVMPALRDASTRSTGSGQVVIQEPAETGKDIIPLGQDGGKIDTAHRLITQVTVVEPS